jgi:hypothetical protein
MNFSTYSVNAKPTQPHRGLNIIQQFPDASAEQRTKNAAIKNILFKKFQFLDISRNKKAEELKHQYSTWPVSRKIGLTEFDKTFQRFNENRQRDRYIKVFLLFIAFGFLTYLFFTFFFEITL